MIDRKDELKKLLFYLKHNRVVAILGARQVGKTTLAHQIIKHTKKNTNYFDLENPEDLSRLSDPMLALKDLKGLVVIDEIQRYPEIFPVLRVLVDRKNIATRFLILGSASPELLQQSSESLAGRIVYHNLGGFSINEVGVDNYQRLWLRGGFPRSYLATTNKASYEWRQAFIRTFLERDIPQMGISIRANTLRRFWSMLAHYHAQIWNASEFGRAFGVADTTVRNYLDLLTHALVLRQLSPWHENISKRQIKSPKIYILDSGLLHALLGIKDRIDLEKHPKIGASWEGFVIEQIIRYFGFNAEECFFWATHGGAEIDLFCIRGRQRLGFEIKLTSSPSVTASMRIAIEDLKLEQVYIIHAGEKTFQLEKKIKAVAFQRILNDF